MEKLTHAEEAKKLQERKRRELEKPVGLARLIQPRANPLLTHRGVGAFTAAEFEIEKEKRQLTKAVSTCKTFWSHVAQSICFKHQDTNKTTSEMRCYA